jgi:hypothetical protein
MDKNMWYIYSMDYDWAVKTNEILHYATTWVEMETIMLSEKARHRKKITHYLFFFFLFLVKGKKYVIEVDSRMVVITG